MKPGELLNLLNLSDSAFPTGGFGHSSGLEYAVQAGWVKDRETLKSWARGMLELSFFTLDLRVALKAWYRVRKGNSPGFWEDLNRNLSSFRSSQIQRRAGAQVGRSFLKSVTSFYGRDVLHDFPEVVDLAGSGDADALQFPLVWGLVCSQLRIGVEAMAHALVFSTLRQQTQVAIRIVPMGQQDAFGSQTELLMELEFPTDWEREAALELEGLAPGLELAGGGMENLPSRYFRS